MLGKVYADVFLLVFDAATLDLLLLLQGVWGFGGMDLDGGFDGCFSLSGRPGMPDFFSKEKGRTRVR